MKTTDLMIGDWVYRPVYEELEPVRVVNIHETGALSVYDGSGDIFFDYESAPYEIRPIPLTPEILEKNADDVYKRCENGYSLFGIGKYPNNIEVTIYPKGGVEWTINGNEYAIADLMYVHQLQHALKLCGIEKEIKL